MPVLRTAEKVDPGVGRPTDLRRAAVHALAEAGEEEAEQRRPVMVVLGTAGAGHGAAHSRLPDVLAAVDRLQVVRGRVGDAEAGAAAAFRIFTTAAAGAVQRSDGKVRTEEEVGEGEQEGLCEGHVCQQVHLMGSVVAGLLLVVLSVEGGAVKAATATTSSNGRCIVERGQRCGGRGQRRPEE